MPQGFDGEAGQIDAHAGGRGEELLRRVNGWPAGLVAPGFGKLHGPGRIVAVSGADPGIDLLRRAPVLERLAIGRRSIEGFSPAALDLRRIRVRAGSAGKTGAGRQENRQKKRNQTGGSAPRIRG